MRTRQEDTVYNQGQWPQKEGSLSTAGSGPSSLHDKTTTWCPATRGGACCGLSWPAQASGAAGRLRAAAREPTGPGPELHCPLRPSLAARGFLSFNSLKLHTTLKCTSSVTLVRTLPSYWAAQVQKGEGSKSGRTFQNLSHLTPRVSTDLLPGANETLKQGLQPFPGHDQRAEVVHEAAFCFSGPKEQDVLNCRRTKLSSTH